MDSLKKYLRRLSRSNITGFSLIMGHTPRELEEGEPVNLTVSIHTDTRSIYNYTEREDVEKEISRRLGFNKHPRLYNTYGFQLTYEQMNTLKKELTSLGYPVTEPPPSISAIGYWCQMKVSCESTEIQEHIDKLKTINYEAISKL